MDKGSLYNVAMQCARLHDSGCALGCGACQYNIFNYGLPVNEASLLKANAYSDYYTRKEVFSEVSTGRSAAELGPLVALLLIVGAFFYTCHTFKSCVTLQPAQVTVVNPSQEVTDREKEVTAAILQFFMNAVEAERKPLTVDEELQYLKTNPNVLDNIPRILNYMKRVGVKDVNKDGKIDCIDYSLTFRSLYGSNARIIINVNQPMGMNHMFIRIRYNSTEIMDIEPQGTADRYSMGAIWGVKYNPYYNKDVTSQWTHVVGGM